MDVGVVSMDVDVDSMAREDADIGWNGESMELAVETCRGRGYRNAC